VDNFFVELNDMVSVDCSLSITDGLQVLRVPSATINKISEKTSLIGTILLSITMVYFNMHGTL